MDVMAAFKNEVFRPVATVVIPGSIAVAPYTLIFIHFHPEVLLLMERYSGFLLTIFLSIIVATGLILENMGSRMESVWDRCLESRTKTHFSEWNEYLSLETQDEIVGQRYLRGIVTRIKFELAFAPALMVSALGLILANTMLAYWRWGPLAMVCLFLIAVAGYLWFESWSSAKVAADARRAVILARSRAS